MYQIKKLDDTVKLEIKEQWGLQAKSFNQDDVLEIINQDTEQSLSNNKIYNQAVFNTETSEYIAIIGRTDSKFQCHKVLDLRLSPKNNPSYEDIHNIGLSNVSNDISGIIIALIEDGFFKDEVNQIKIFARGSEMKKVFDHVANQLKDNSFKIKVYFQASWLIIEA